jgi:hypothetical protein
LGAKTKFPRTDGLVALSAYIIKPHYAAKGTGIVLPKSIKWARLDLRPGADGGGVLHILAEDSGNKQAKEHAALLEALVDQITSVDLSKGGAWGGVASLLMGTKKVKMIQSVEFSADGKKIRGKLVATKNQLLNLADLLAALLPPMPEEQAQNGPLNPSGPNASEPSLDQASPEQELPAASPAADPLEDRSPTPDLPAEEARIPESAPQTPPEPEQDPEPKESNPPRSSER